MSLNKLLLVIVFLVSIVVALGLVIRTNSSVDSQTSTTTSETHRIVFMCNDDDDIVDTAAICIINRDGTGLRTVVTGVFPGPFSTPGMNDRGQIIYRCDNLGLENESILDSDVCLINADGTGSLRINPHTSVANDIAPMINNAGQIAFDCYFICFAVVNDDLTLETPLQKFSPPDYRRKELLPMGLNNKGQGVYNCRSTVRFDDQAAFEGSLCKFDLATPSAEVLLQGSESAGYYSAAINDSGLIVFICSDATSSQICSINFDGSDEKRLTDQLPLGYVKITDMNNRGDIVFECSPRGWPVYICSMNVDDTEYRQITSDQTGDGTRPVGDWAPSISEDGVIAYACGKHLCVINFDGTGQRQLTTEPSDLGVGQPVIRGASKLFSPSEKSLSQLTLQSLFYYY